MATDEVIGGVMAATGQRLAVQMMELTDEASRRGELRYAPTLSLALSMWTLGVHVGVAMAIRDITIGRRYVDWWQRAEPETTAEGQQTLDMLVDVLAEVLEDAK